MARVHIVFYLFFNHLIHIIMNTIFYSLTKRGEQIVFCMTLTLFMSAFSFTASGQSYYSYFGENTFRNYGTSGVLNHNYFVDTRIGTGSLLIHGPFNTNYFGNCGVYESLIRLNNTSTTMNNELRVRPTCPNTPADYLDGCTTMDLLLIDRHISGIQPFTDGYQKLAADVNKSNSITSADKTMLQQLILGVTTSFTRNSWEWFEPSYIAQFPTGFFNSPWQYCLSAIWPNVGGFGERRWTGLSRNQIATNQLAYFVYKTVKIGDVGRGNSSVAPNSYICFPPVYFGENDTDSRTVSGESLISQAELRKNDEIEVAISVEVDAELSAIMLPLSIDDKYLETIEVNFLNDFSPKYHYSKLTKTLTILDVTADPESKIKLVNGENVIVRLKVKQDIKNIFDHISWERNLRNIELINVDAEYTSGNVSLELKNVFPSQERMKVINNGSTLEFFSTVNENSNLTISGVDGKIVHSVNVNLSEGINYIELPEINQAGIYIATIYIYNNSKIVSEKYIK